MDNLGWTEQKAVLYFGIMTGLGSLIMGSSSYCLVGRMTNRYDERILFILFGILGPAVSAFIAWPLPSSPLPTLRNDSVSIATNVVPPIHNATTTSIVTKLIQNVNCREQIGEPGCDLVWCRYIPRIMLWQLVPALAIASLSVSFNWGLGPSMLSRILRPGQQQVCQTLVYFQSGIKAVK